MMSNFKDNSDKVIRELQDAVYKGVTKASEIVETQAKLNAPVDTGKLGQSINNHVEGARTNTITGYIGTNTEYAIYVEKGTGEFATNGLGRKTPWTYQKPNGEWVTTTGQKPQPFLEPAFKDNVNNIAKAIKDELKKVGD